MDSSPHWLADEEQAGADALVYVVMCEMYEAEGFPRSTAHCAALHELEKLVGTTRVAYMLRVAMREGTMSHPPGKEIQ